MFLKQVAVGGGLAVFLSLSAAAQSTSNQWLIERVTGSWEVREGQRVRRIGGKFDVLTVGSQVRCVAGPCQLEYSVDGGPAKPLFPKPPALSQWVAVPQPKEPPVARTAADMQRIIGSIGVRGGADKSGPGCGGDLPLRMPACNETVDPTQFKLEWTPRSTEAGRLFTLLLGSVDSSQKRRWTVASDAGQFQDKALEQYLADLQLPDRATDVTVRLMRTESFDAVRLVRLRSRADTTELQRKLQSFGRLTDLARQLATLEEFLKLEMWSSAASVSLSLLRDAPDSLEVWKYALVGLCGSDFADEIAKLRSALRDAGVAGLCEAEGVAK